MTEYKCDLCGDSGNTHDMAVKGRMLARCRQCGLVSYYPLPKEDDLVRLHDDENYRMTTYFTLNDEGLKTSHYRQTAKAADMAVRTLKHSDRILEIGPGNGHFLRLCREKGLNIEGLEISAKTAGDLQKKYGWAVHAGVLGPERFESNSYSMVVAFDVIEHCLSPKQFLEDIRRILKPHGTLVLSTVNIANLLDKIGHLLYLCGIKKPVEKLYPPHHLYYFTARTMEEYLKATGYGILKLHQENYDYRKATADPFEQLVLRTVYTFHNLSGNKTNLYITAQKI